MVTVYVGSHSHGQGHATAFSQIAADALGLHYNHIELKEGDTDQVPFGNGTWGSRSASVGGAAIVEAAERVIDKATRLAAHVLECAVGDLEYSNGNFALRGTDRSITFSGIADIAYHGSDLPPDRSLEPGLEATAFYEPTDTNDPQAMHLVTVMVDVETGVVTLRDYFTSDDCGRIINPMIVEGQIHGGLAQGIGQALLENVTYDPDTAQLLSGTWLDYTMPHAAQLPSFELNFRETPTAANPLGVKGSGQAGCMAAPQTIMAAVLDALKPLDITDMDMPATPERLWRAIKAAST